MNFSGFQETYNNAVTAYLNFKKQIKRFVFPFFPFIVYFICVFFFYFYEYTFNDLMFANTDLMDRNKAWYLYNIVLNVFLFFYFLIWYLRKFHLNREEKNYYGYEKLNTQGLFRILIVFISFNLCLDSGLSLYEHFFPKTVPSEMNSFYDWPLYAIFLFTCILTPATEELMARGIGFNIARAMDTPLWYANFTQGLFFALMHNSGPQRLYAFLFSLLIGYIYNKYGSLIMAIGLHVLFNIWGLLVSGYISKLPIWALIISFVMFLAVFGYISLISIEKDKRVLLGKIRRLQIERQINKELKKNE